MKRTKVKKLSKSDTCQYWAQIIEYCVQSTCLEDGRGFAHLCGFAADNNEPLRIKLEIAG